MAWYHAWAALCCAAGLLLRAQGVPFYLYDSPAYDWLGNCSTEWSKELDARRRAMHGGEVLFADQIARSTERMAEADAAQARVYVVPALLVFGLDHGDEERWQPTNDTCRGATFREMQDATADALLASPHFQRRGGADHLLVADSYKTFLLEHDGHFTPKFSKVLENMTVGYFETREQKGLQRAWRCTLVVPYVHKPPVHMRRSAPALGTDAKGRAMRQLSMARRDFGIFFMGKTKGQPWDPTVYATRRRIATMLGEWADLPMTYVSSTSMPPQPGFEPMCDARACAEAPRCVACTWNASAPGRLYEQRLARSEFSLIIRGDSPSTSRLYDALVNGVIPIVVSDLLWFKGLPFPGHVPWADLVFVLPEDFEAADLRMIANAPADMKERKRRAGRAHLQDVSWTVPGSRVADNVVSEAARYCM